MQTSALSRLARPVFGSHAIRWLAYLGLCAAYLQGGLNKLMDFQGAVGEMSHFGLSPASLLAGLVIALELGASVMILSGKLRWLGAGSGRVYLDGVFCGASFLGATSRPGTLHGGQFLL